MAISASINYSEDDYDKSDYGLQFSRVSSYKVDVTWAPSAELCAYAFASEERYKTDQDGQSFGGATRGTQITDPARDWHVKSRDDVFSYGFGFSTKFLEDAVTVGIDYVCSESDTDILTTTGTGLTRANLPTAVSDLLSASVFANYQWCKNIKFRMRMAYEDYESTDWSMDSVPPNQLAHVILLGESSPDYSVMVTTFTVAYRF